MRLPIAILAITVFGFAQTTPEPEIADIFYRLDNSKLVPLERQAASYKGGAHGFIVMSMKSASVFPGAKSPIRFKGGDPFTFIVRSMLPVGSVDPNTTYYLRRLDQKKKTRELVMMSGHVAPFSVSTTTTPSSGLLQVDFGKYGASSLKMITGILPAGEYAVGKPYSASIFCFGVD